MRSVSILPEGRANHAKLRAKILAGTAVASLFAGAASAAYAQGAASVETITVTGSRLTTAGFDAPTPTQVIGTLQIEQAAYPSVYDSVAALPALEGNASPINKNGDNSGGVNGLSTLDARALGPTRTLVLIDGQRVGPANINGTDDVGLFPQLLIQRVDVVTGGASASYGSDAVAGVVNFILNKNFTGFKANVEASITNYGDDASVLSQAAWGTDLLGGKMHFEASGEYYKNAGVPSRPYGLNGGTNGRSVYYANVTATRSIAATPAGQPENVTYAPAQVSSYALGGLITAGPLKGTAFGPGGTPYQFQYGSNCIGTTCQGGELTSNVGATSALDANLSRVNGFTRLSYDVTPDLNVYAQVSYGEVKTKAQVNQGAAQQANRTIQCDNAFLPASIVAACAANKITSFQYGVSNLIFPASPGVTVARKQPRYVFGFEDKDFEVFGTRWDVQGYYQHAELHELLNVTNSILIPRYAAAIDAVQVTAANQATYASLNGGAGVPIGQIVCRSVVADASGCVPWNAIGVNPVNMQSWAYINPTNGPFAGVQQHQEAAELNFSGAPFQNWAGDVSVAFGAAYRLEAYHQLSDWYGNGLSAQSQPNAKYPADPVLLTTGSNYYAGSFYDGRGSYNVTEGFLEIGIPLVNNATFGKADWDMAGRYESYSTAGDVSTWKLGVTWDTPVQGVRLRAVASRDVRAPNLSELFPAPLSTNNTVTNLVAIPASSLGPAIAAGQSVNAAGLTLGNPQLKSERAQNLEAGIVYQPDWLPGFQASIDYFGIKINGAIAVVTGQQFISLCQLSGIQSACGQFQLQGTLGTANQPTFNALPENYASYYTSGYDIGAAWQGDVEDIGLPVPGTLAVGLKASHVNSFIVNLGLPNTQITHDAGLNGGVNPGLGSAPKWKGLMTESWNWDKIGLTAIQRAVSAGYAGPDNILCQAPNCPLPTIQNPTVNFNNIPGAVYFDIGGSYQFTPEAQLYFKIENLANHNIPMGGTAGTYDILGRFYRVGVRITD